MILMLLHAFRHFCVYFGPSFLQSGKDFALFGVRNAAALDFTGQIIAVLSDERFDIARLLSAELLHQSFLFVRRLAFERFLERFTFALFLFQIGFDLSPTCFN